MTMRVAEVSIEEDCLTSIVVAIRTSLSKEASPQNPHYRRYDGVRLQFEGEILGVVTRSQTYFQECLTLVEFWMFRGRSLSPQQAFHMEHLRRSLSRYELEPFWQDDQTLALAFPEAKASRESIPCKAERAVSLLRSVGVPAYVSSNGVTIREKNLDEVIAFVELYRRKR